MICLIHKKIHCSQNSAHENFILDLQQRRLHEAQDEYDQEQEILKEEFDTERWIYKGLACITIH